MKVDVEKIRFSLSKSFRRNFENHTAVYANI